MKKYPRPNAVVIERSSVVTRYAKFHPMCEFGEHLESHFKIRQSQETHHIFGGRSGRNDTTTNIIRLSKDAHDWCHKFPTDGRILCLWIKSEKLQLLRDEFKEASGYFIEGWLEKATCRNEFVKEYLRQLRKAYQ